MQPAHTPHCPWARHLMVLSALLALAPIVAPAAENLPLERVKLPLEPSLRIEDLSVGQQQRVEILKALWRDARVLILDEPTAVLTPLEVDQLFTAVRQMRAEGQAIVFISHKLGEVKAICDDLTVLRRGSVAWEGRAEDVSAEDLAHHMVGRDVAAQSGTGKLSGLPVAARERHPQAKTLASATLSLEQVGAPALREVSLAIQSGEILGIAGVDGNGQQELAEIVVGLRRITAGRILMNGDDVASRSLKQRVGLAHIPNDRKLEALITTMSITENLSLKRFDRPPIARAIRKDAARSLRGLRSSLAARRPLSAFEQWKDREGSYPN